VSLLRELKKQATLLVVSHDLADIAPLVDCAWRMQVRASRGPPVLGLPLCALASRHVRDAQDCAACH
jgi:energy-coupling factor transporter ATP-binding protein EcfA2